jgi:hypothetical protein
MVEPRVRHNRGFEGKRRTHRRKQKLFMDQVIYGPETVRTPRVPTALVRPSAIRRRKNLRLVRSSEFPGALKHHCNKWKKSDLVEGLGPHRLPVGASPASQRRREPENQRKQEVTRRCAQHSRDFPCAGL